MGVQEVFVSFLFLSIKCIYHLRIVKCSFYIGFFQVCKCCETTHILAIKCNISMFHSSIFKSSCKDSAVLSFSLPEMDKKKFLCLQERQHKTCSPKLF